MLEQIFTSDDTIRDPGKSAHSPIRNFFRGKTVFLTGGTGFLGKLFIEKLLQCEVREIVLLVRSKRGRTPRERLQRQLEREPVSFVLKIPAATSGKSLNLKMFHLANRSTRNMRGMPTSTGAGCELWRGHWSRKNWASLRWTWII